MPKYLKPTPRTVVQEEVITGFFWSGVTDLDLSQHFMGCVALQPPPHCQSGSVFPAKTMGTRMRVSMLMFDLRK